VGATTLLTTLLATALALVHLFAAKMRFLDVTPRSVWLSAAGGVSVAYVFVHLLPDLVEEQEAIREAVQEALAFVEGHAYLVALLGLAVFYGLEWAAKTSRGRRRRSGKEDVTGGRVFWLHVASFAIYNVLIGYLLLHREEPGLQGLVLFAFVMAVHFVVNDYGLREDHKAAYERVGRWVLAAAILAGWAVLETDGSVTIIPGTDLGSTSALTNVAGWRPEQKRAPGANTRIHPKQG
jgi:hypothetical protein